jgi:hypothetical protein
MQNLGRKFQFYNNDGLVYYCCGMKHGSMRHV